MYKILIADSLDPAGLVKLRESGAEVHEVTAEEKPRLPEILADYDALVVRSSTQVTAELMRAGKRLKVVGRAGIGVDNVDVAAATELGILVVNAPTANLVSATEHTFALLFALARKVPFADASMKAGKWDRKITGLELQDKTIGIIGFGRIGQKVAARARAFDMKVLAFDPFLDANAARRLEVELVSLEDLLRRSDVLTFHTPLTEQTRNLLNRERIATMKKGALVINVGRGGVVDEAALLEALESGHLGGAALDVFAEEPPKDLTLIRHPKVVATPHLGAQTREAQERISTETADMLLAALSGSLAVAAVNLPFRAAGPKVAPYMELGETLGRMAAQLLDAGPQRLQVDLWGVEEGMHTPVTMAVLMGVLATFLRNDMVNYVNAERLAASRHIAVVRSVHTEESDYPNLVGVTLSGGDRTVELGGTLFGERDPRVVRFGGFRFEFHPEGNLLFVENQDVPGVVGKVGTLLADNGINIADIHLARTGRVGPGGEREALAVLRLDQEMPEELLGKLIEIGVVRSAHRVDLTKR
ncbi:MAG TPA: phosphoglycerate dehydrogenase [Acidobacteria bacterium]|nr:phosphoglycerate dehydrogenase [Acidobacteriota bacterium]